MDLSRPLPLLLSPSARTWPEVQGAVSTRRRGKAILPETRAGASRGAAHSGRHSQFRGEHEGAPISPPPGIPLPRDTPPQGHPLPRDPLGPQAGLSPDTKWGTCPRPPSEQGHAGMPQSVVGHVAQNPLLIRIRNPSTSPGTTSISPTSVSPVPAQGLAQSGRLMERIRAYNPVSSPRLERS